MNRHLRDILILIFDWLMVLLVVLLIPGLAYVVTYKSERQVIDRMNRDLDAKCERNQ
jgi:hypothetical protein